MLIGEFRRKVHWCVSLCNHFNFSVTMKFIKIKGWGGEAPQKIGKCGAYKERWIRQSKSIFGQCGHVYLWQCPGKRSHRVCRVPETFSHYGSLNSLGLSLYFLPGYWRCSFALWPEASVSESLKRKLVVHWRDKWGKNTELQIECSAVWLTSRNDASVF